MAERSKSNDVCGCGIEAGLLAAVRRGSLAHRTRVVNQRRQTKMELEHSSNETPDTERSGRAGRVAFNFRSREEGSTFPSHLFVTSTQYRLRSTGPSYSQKIDLRCWPAHRSNKHIHCIKDVSHFTAFAGVERP